MLEITKVAFENYGIASFRHDGLGTSGQVDLVLCCVDNYEARMTVNIVSTCNTKR